MTMLADKSLQEQKLEKSLFSILERDMMLAFSILIVPVVHQLVYYKVYSRLFSILKIPLPQSLVYYLLRKLSKVIMAW